jgi:hypothetical protein
VEYTRQRLLGQYAQLASKAETVMAESAEDVRVLARLWQLKNKMESVGAGGGGAAVMAAVAGGPVAGPAAAARARSTTPSSYSARIDRVSSACAGIEQRLSKRIELLDGYARVMNMIEIEVEMELQVRVASLCCRACNAVPRCSV